MLCLTAEERRFRLQEGVLVGLQVLRLGLPRRGPGRRRGEAVLCAPGVTVLPLEPELLLPPDCRLADTSTLAAARAAELLLTLSPERERVLVSLGRLGRWERRCLATLASRVRRLTVDAPEPVFREAMRLLAPLGVSPLPGQSAEAAIRFDPTRPIQAPLILDPHHPLPPGLLLSPYPEGSLPLGCDPLKVASYAVERGLLSPGACITGK